MKTNRVTMTHPEIPGSKCNVLPEAAHVWEDRGWVVDESEDSAAIVPSGATPLSEVDAQDDRTDITSKKGK